eukprot:362051-Chlamydomonas_euryale.AAC.4
MFRIDFWLVLTPGPVRPNSALGCDTILRVQGLSQASGHGLGLRLLRDSVTNPRLGIAARQAPTPVPSGRARAIASRLPSSSGQPLACLCATLRHRRSHMKPRVYLLERPVQFLAKKLVYPRGADRDSPSMGCQHLRCMSLHGGNDQSTN